MASIIPAGLPCLRDRFLFFFLLTPDAGPGYLMPLRGSGL